MNVLFRVIIFLAKRFPRIIALRLIRQPRKLASLKQYAAMEMPKVSQNLGTKVPRFWSDSIRST